MLCKSNLRYIRPLGFLKLMPFDLYSLYALYLVNEANQKQEQLNFLREQIGNKRGRN